MRKTVALLAAALIAGAAVPARAEDPLREAREAHARAEARARALAARVGRLAERVHRVEGRAAEAAALVVDAYREQLLADARVAEARGDFTARARAVYQAGPAGLLEVLLSAATVSDLLTARRIIEETFLGEMDRVAGALDGRAGTRALGRELERRKDRLAALHRRLGELLDRLEADLGAARAAAEEAGVRVAALEREQHRLERAREREAERRALISGGADQAELLEMLGPSGGRGCTMPEGLAPTGRRFEGLASWYGWEFAGRPTASGAIFDPRLFTAAHRTLPLPSFVHVRRGDRCATVLVNDRGPFIEGRVLDLSMAAARYLGVGVTQVEVEVLAPR